MFLIKLLLMILFLVLNEDLFRKFYDSLHITSNTFKRDQCFKSGSIPNK